ncbi:2,3-bisphosphoglycerate-independent phosphoglycerate mutase [bacterium HR40]|nr:2,3-bisphosphoglycerate-independent phosphoglycerate mutase [bacterium HR40]
MSDRPRPVVLCILDGWGYREEREANAVALAPTPVFDRCWASLPRCLLRTDGPAVGLPEGQFGNSEVGHMNLGAGRIVLQDLPRVDRWIEDRTFERSGRLAAAAQRIRAAGGRLHLLGLLSAGGVHAHRRHILALARMFAAAGIPVLLHLFTDGRDTPPRSADSEMAWLRSGLQDQPLVRVATVSGRYYAMDRDRRWERTQRAWRAIVLAEGERAADPEEAVRRAWERDFGDEFLPPTVIGDYEGMRDGDGLLCANFRADRVRQLLSALVDPGFAEFPRPCRPELSWAAGLMSYSRELDRLLEVLIPPEKLERVMGEVVAAAGLTQLRIAETEKYPHVTYFFNGGREQPFAGEERILVPSPKVPTYDLKPEMSAEPVTDRLVDAIQSHRFDFVLVNYANPDMVGHTGSLEAAIAAVETVDRCLGRLLAAVETTGGMALVTADHGNCELMRDPESGGPHTAHTYNPVPCFLFGARRRLRLRDGILADVAPTLLPFLGLEQPPEMTGRSLIAE